MRPLPDLEADRERRDRGVTLKEWLDAPPPPPTRAGCEDGERPCPALRCIHHLGKRGDGSFTCQLDFADLPEDERTYEKMAAVLGVSKQAAFEAVRDARDKAFRRAPHDVLIALGIRRRHARQP